MFELLGEQASESRLAASSECSGSVLAWVLFRRDLTSVSLGQLRGSNLGIVLSRSWSAVAQPLHQLTQIHPVFGIVELGGEPN